MTAITAESLNTAVAGVLGRMTVGVGATFVVAALIVSTPVMASGDLAKSRGCMACHAVDRKLVGPSYQEIAKKYRGDAQAPDTLTAKVKKGGAGVWGPIPMPPHAHVSDADIKSMVKWILAQ